MKNKEFNAKNYFKLLSKEYLSKTSKRKMIEDAFTNGQVSAKSWYYTNSRVPTENYTVDVYVVRLNSLGNKELISAYYEDGKFLRYNEKYSKIEEIDSVYAWKYRDELPEY